MRVVFALATAATASAVLVERSDLALGWKASSTNLAKTASVSATDEFSFHVIVKDQNMDKLRDFVDAISDPKNEMYGESMTAEEVSAFTAPAEADTKTVMQWLEQAEGCQYSVDSAGRHVWVTCSVAAAEKLLSTKIGHLVNSVYGQEVIRAGDYTIPDEVDAAVAAVFGLHGLPLPKYAPLVSSSDDPSQPVAVTPDVIATTYKVSGVTPKGGLTNRMAVAEFQGQNEEDADLAKFFKTYVKNAQPGDEKIYKFVGDPDQQQAGIEASLDIQYIMGVAPHLKAEFWLWDANDFCLDLENWTSVILSQGNDGPNVHSVSYGWQGDLDQLQCTPDKYNVVDANFAKVAATRASIVFASGDSGSGYAPPAPDCSKIQKDTGLKGTIQASEKVQSAQECCYISAQASAGYSFNATGAPTPGAQCTATDYGKKDTAYQGTIIESFNVPSTEPELCCEASRGTNFYFNVGPGSTSSVLNCSYFSAVTGTVTAKGSYAGIASTPAEGTCTLYSTVTGTTPTTGIDSGTVTPGAIKLWPAWPASSPYVTSVGATRFVDQTVGQPEMATDQFGSGGGFSDMFDQTHATWQTAAVSAYTSNPPKDPTYPPAGSFSPTGRATPDVGALGEGFQVFTDGQVQSVGGTSASAPTFAAILSLLNEARDQAGKPPLGLANAFIYQNADCFRDVTLGTNAIGRGTGPLKYGFNATAGWDPATGLGTPIFDKLLAAALKA